MNEYIVNTSLGYMLVRAKNEKEAWIEYVTTDSMPLGDFCLDADGLLKRGYVAVVKTTIENVFLLKKY